MAEADEAEIKRRQDALAEEMKILIRADDLVATRLGNGVDWLYWSGITASALATILGLVHSQYIEVWMISALAGLSTVTTIIRRDTNLREKSNWFYERRDVVASLRRKLLYEGPVPLTAQYVSDMSQELAKRHAALGDKMAAIHKRTEAHKG